MEEVEDPSLKDRPVIVCVFSGRTENSGVVSTANYKAREFGVRSGMPIILAMKRLEGKEPAVIRMDHQKYEVVSKRIMEIVEQTVDILEPTGIDEAFFDLSKSTEGDFAKARAIAQNVKEAIFREEMLTCSIGLGRSKVVAKLGSDMSKPNGLMVIEPDNTAVMLAPLPVTNLFGVGPKTATILERIHVKTVGELAGVPAADLERQFGRNVGYHLLAAATGTDEDPVVSGLEQAQFSRILTLKRDTRDVHEVFSQLGEGIAYIMDKLATSKKTFRTVTVIGILTDLSTKTKSKTLESGINDATTLRETALVLFQELTNSIDKDYRRAGVRVSGLASKEDQSSLSDFVSPVK